MQFCSDCETRLVQSRDDVGGPRICPQCHPEQSQTQIPTRAVNHSGITKPCSKGCGSEIYWDELFRTDGGKFIPIDSQTDEPHQCNKSTVSDGAAPDETTLDDTVPAETASDSKPKDRETVSQIPIPQSILFDVAKIPKALVEKDGIIHRIIQGHKEESLALIHYERLTAPEAEKIPIESLDDVLSENIIQGLERYGFKGLLPFQDESVREILKGNNTIISAPTGSGKTEAFAIPILQKISGRTTPGVFALLVYPLNALIDDQVSKLTNLIQKCKLAGHTAAYSIHGGQSTEYKDMVIAESKKKSLIIATNFDFINYHMILQDKKWNELFKTAKIIVMDEAHSYTSFYGSNVYHVLQRMERYMTKVQYVGSSATLDNSKEFFSNMFNIPKDSFSYIKSKLRRRQDMHMFFIMPRKFRQRATMELLSSLCYKNKSVQLVFSNTHNDAEFLASNVEGANKGIRIQVHRGGLDQKDRKLYESQMKAGELDVLSCTPTLELGIDIGHVDVVISAFKNEFDSFIQRIGRAGRRGQRSYAICVFDSDDATCHYFARHMTEYLNQTHTIQISKKNPIISERHEESKKVEAQAASTNAKSQFFDFANTVNLRGTSGEIAIYYNTRKIGTRGIPVGYYQLHQNAIYHFNKQNYEVTSLLKSSGGARAYLRRSDERGKRTIPIVKTLLIEESKLKAVHKTVCVNSNKLDLRYGMISLDRTISGYMKGNYNESTDKFQVHYGSLTPGWKSFHWKSEHSSVGITVPPEFIAQSVSESKNTITDDPGIHTISHILVNASKILTKSESSDIDVYYDAGVIYLYDNSSDGFNGCSKIIYDEFEKVLDTGFDLLNDCDCPTGKSQEDDWGGCPKCTFTTNYCQTKNKDLSKDGAKKFFATFH